MAAFSILGVMEVDKILRAVPPNLREQVRMVARPNIQYHVVLFGRNQDHGSVNLSAVVRKALQRLPDDAAILAIGQDFTLEATQLLDERDATIARASAFGWTDERYLYIKNREWRR